MIGVLKIEGPQPKKRVKVVLHFISFQPSCQWRWNVHIHG